VYFAVPESWSEADERRVVAEVAALLPARVHLELDGRYAAMLSHEPKNYALLGYDGKLTLRGVAFRSSRAEPFGEEFLREAVSRLLVDDIVGVRDAFVRTVVALRRRQLPTPMVAAEVRLTKSRAEYAATRDKRRELPYEAMLAAGWDEWEPNERVKVYRGSGGRALLLDEDADEDALPRDYDVDYYVRVLRDTFASRLARALTPDDFAAVVADPEQPSLFPPPLDRARTVLTGVTLL
jgi:DNA polymerase elongation subunit (family B)